jgi:hypothetical protein
MCKYILIFSSTYLLSLITVLILSEAFDLNGSTTVATLMAGAMITSMVFVKDHKRGPNKSEKRTLVWGSLLSAIVVSSLLVTVYLLISEEGSNIVEVLIQVPAWIWVLSAVVVSIVYAAFLAFCYGWLTEKLFVKNAN